MLRSERRCAHGSGKNRRIHRPMPERGRLHPGRPGGEAGDHRPGGLQMGDWGISKLKIPHQSHADFCSTDTAGGLDNKKRRYAPPWRRGAYRLFLWGFPKGACPHWHTTLLAKCSVLYLLAWLTGETGCGASCTPFAPAGKQAEFLRMGMSKKSACFQRTAAGI